jgi:hypothetical protein
MQLSRNNIFFNLATHFTKEKHYLKFDKPKIVKEKNQTLIYTDKKKLKKICELLESRQVTSCETGIFRKHILDKHIKLTTRELFCKKLEVGDNLHESRIILYDCNREINDDVIQHNIIKLSDDERINFKLYLLSNIINTMLNSCKKEIENIKNYNILSDFFMSSDKQKITWRISICECCCNTNSIPFAILKHRNSRYYTNVKNLIIFKDKNSFWNLRFE